MVQRTFYMVSSIIMDGAEDRKTLEEARIVAKKEAIRLSKTKYKGTRDNWVTIDKFVTAPQHKDKLLEAWKWSGSRFIRKSINGKWG